MIAELFPDGPAAFDLRAVVDSSGRSLRPEQLQHWLGELLGQPLTVTALRRRALLLKPVLAFN